MSREGSTGGSGASVAVIGALGFVASRLLPRLRERGDRAIAIVRPSRDATALERAGIEVRRADAATGVGLDAAVADVRRVVHLAGMALGPSVVPALERAGVERAVFVSSAGVYTRLASGSAEAKRVGERVLLASSVDGTILRPSMIYGTAADRNLARLLRWLLRSPIVPLPGGRQLQQPVHVDDLVAAILAALERPIAAGRAYDVGGPEALPLTDLVRRCARALGRPAWIVPVPVGPVRELVVAARALGLPTPVRPEQLARLAESKAVDISAARADLQFRPRPFDEGIRAEAQEVLAGG